MAAWRQPVRLFGGDWRSCPVTGPFWFGNLKIMEREDLRGVEYAYIGASLRPCWASATELARGLSVISKELIWKLHLECAQAEERMVDRAATHLQRLSSRVPSLNVARDSLLGRQGTVWCALCWPVPATCGGKYGWSGHGRNLRRQNGKSAQVATPGTKSCPAKSRTSVFLECSRAEEHFGNIDCARRILLRTRRDFKGDWKLYLEAALLEARCGNFLGAMDIVRSGLAAHRGTGRLWSVYLQLSHRLEGLYTRPSRPHPHHPHPHPPPPPRCFRGSRSCPRRRCCCSSLQVPKSGEVWSEGAKCLLNPLHTRCFDPGEAQRYLSFAIRFTPIRRHLRGGPAPRGTVPDLHPQSPGPLGAAHSALLGGVPHVRCGNGSSPHHHFALCDLCHHCA